MALMDSGLSTNVLVEAARFSTGTQYITALSATLGGMIMGIITGFTSPTGPQLTSEVPLNATDTFRLTTSQMSWVSSIANLGAVAGGPTAGVFMNLIGRKGAMLVSFGPVAAGWLLIGLGYSFWSLMIGRFLTGVTMGMVSLVVPTYIGEFASASIRGTLGTGFQLMATFGILFIYVFGAVLPTWRWLCLASLVIPVVFFVSMLLCKESPRYLLAKGKNEEARKSLQHFRGKQYNIQSELEIMQQSLKESQENKASFSDLRTPYILKPFLISLTLMFFRQFCGFIPVIFNLETIFEEAGSSFSSNASSIIIGLVQFISALSSSFLVDKSGRRFLLILSSLLMTASLFSLGLFFYIKDYDPGLASDSLAWLPLTSLTVFIIAFSIGLGPIPWLMIGELFSPNVKEVTGSLVIAVNWLFAFVVTVTYAPLQKGIQDYGVYWLYSFSCALGVIFCVVVVPETKKKTLEQITAGFGRTSASPPLQGKTSTALITTTTTTTTTSISHRT